MTYPLTTIEQDTITQYVDGKTLLCSILTERARLLQTLEQLAQAPQGQTSSENVAEFPLIRAQTLLYELSMIGEDIGMLVFEINQYATRCGKPPVQLIDMNLQ